MTQKHSLTIQAVSIIGGILTAIFWDFWHLPESSAPIFLT